MPARPGARCHIDIGDIGVSGGAMVRNPLRVGIEPKDVDVVLFSHLHRDHTGWIVDPAGAATSEAHREDVMFPSALHCLSEVEWDYWTEQAASGRATWSFPEAQLRAS
ncbi:MAG: MBL fold metallo-hydrolase [Acidimicrobiales bacterium]|nr:MBL fold metallo-hydrolase [Acidimicrobiales bacterium]